MKMESIGSEEKQPGMSLAVRYMLQHCPFQSSCSQICKTGNCGFKS